MKRFLYTFLFTLITVLFSTESRAQEYVPFPLSNAIWSEVFTSKQPDEVETYQFGIEGDTVYNNIQYSKLYLLNDTVYPLSVGRYCGGIREDDMKRIYIIDCDCVMIPTIPIIDEVALYDFSKSIGDTLFVGIYSFYPYSYFIINEIDSILIDGNYRKRFDFGVEEWIEGIGSTRGLLSPIQEQPTGYQKWKLICLNQEGSVTYLNPDFNSCFPILTSIEEQEQQPHLMIYPHPVTNTSYLEVGAQLASYEVLEVYNILGKLEKRIAITPGETRIELNNKDFRTGIYLVVLKAKSQLLISDKILVINN